MELWEYPRPENDTGLGIHWCTGSAGAAGLSRIRDFWIPEMKAMGFKWVKIHTHDGAEDFVELLLSEGFMPIIRIYRAHPNPGRLGIKDLVDVDVFIRIGARYFEFNHQPDQDAEWKGGRVPANGIDLVIEDTIADMEAILERGGMPGIPAVASGSRWDLVGKIVEVGRRDLLSGPVWQAIHNYAHNRPLDYPYDIGNQEGAAYTQRFYHALASEHPGFDPWHNRSLGQINQLRLEHRNPGATVADDPACWLAYEFIAERNRHHLGQEIPILSTEGGYLVGDNLDPRYPATTPDLHMAQTLEACRIMMGSSQRFRAAPDEYFCSMFTLLANAELGSQSGWLESRAWYSKLWRGHSLPIVKTLRVEPKILRRWQNEAHQATRVTLHGIVYHATNEQTIILDQNGIEVARVRLDEENRYRFPDLAPGTYTIRIEHTNLLESVTLLADQPSAVLNLDLGDLLQEASGAIQGMVRAGAGAMVMLLRMDDGQEWVTMAKEDGTFRFVDLPVGTYNARIYPSGSRIDGLILKNDEENRPPSETIELSVDGWGYTTTYEPITEGSANPEGIPENRHSHRLPDAIRCIVAGRKNLSVQARSGAWYSAPVKTGSAPAYGEFACEIPILEARHDSILDDDSPSDTSLPDVPHVKDSRDFIVSVEGVIDEEGAPVSLEARVTLQLGMIPVVTFEKPSSEKSLPHRNSVIMGQVMQADTRSDQSLSREDTGGQFPQEIQIVLTDEQTHQQIESVDERGHFAFRHLSAGSYSVAILGAESTTRQSDIKLDGGNQVQVSLYLSTQQTDLIHSLHNEGSKRNSVIVGIVPNAVGQVAKLMDSVGNEYTRMVSDDGRVRFEQLQAGTYALMIEDIYQESGLTVDGEEGLEVFFTPVVTKWEATVSSAGSMPGFSAVRVEVNGERDLPVYLSREDWDGLMQRTGSKPALGEFALEFSPLDPGYYIIEPEGLDVRATVELTGLEAVWVTFHQQAAPSSPNVILPLAGESVSPGVTEDSTPQEEMYTTYSRLELPELPPISDILHQEEPSDLSLDTEHTYAISEEADSAVDRQETEVYPPDDSEQADSKQADSEQVDNKLNHAVEESEPTPYLFISSNGTADAQTIDGLIAVLKYVSAMQPQVGNDLGEAAKAQQVVIVGEVDPMLIEELELSGVQVEQVSGSLIDAFSQLNR